MYEACSRFPGVGVGTESVGRWYVFGGVPYRGIYCDKQGGRSHFISVKMKLVSLG